MGKLEGDKNQTTNILRATVLTLKKYLSHYKVMLIVLKGKCGKCGKFLINILRRYFTMWEIEGMVNSGLPAKHFSIDSLDECTMNRSVNRELPFH